MRKARTTRRLRDSDAGRRRRAGATIAAVPRSQVFDPRPGGGSASGAVRTFATGATRDSEVGKLDYEGFLSPRVLKAFARYMDHHRRQADGSLRDSDNWQRGIPPDAYMKSGWRHFMAWWAYHRNLPTDEGVVFACCGVMFNVMGYLHEHLKEHPELIGDNEAVQF